MKSSSFLSVLAGLMAGLILGVSVTFAYELKHGRFAEFISIVLAASSVFLLIFSLISYFHRNSTAREWCISAFKADQPTALDCLIVCFAGFLGGLLACLLPRDPLVHNYGATLRVNVFVPLLAGVLASVIGVFYVANFDPKNRFRTYACAIVFGFGGLFVFDIAKTTLGVQGKTVSVKSFETAQDEARQLLSTPYRTVDKSETKEAAALRFHQDCASAVELIQLGASTESDTDEKGLNLLAMMLINDMTDLERLYPSFTRSDLGTLDRCMSIYEVPALLDSLDSLESSLSTPVPPEVKDQTGYVRWLIFSPQSSNSSVYVVPPDCSLFDTTPANALLKTDTMPVNLDGSQYRSGDDIFVEKGIQGPSAANTDIYLRKDPPSQASPHGTLNLGAALGILKQGQKVTPIANGGNPPYLIYGPNEKGDRALWVFVRVDSSQ